MQIMKHTLLLFATALLLGMQSYAQTGVAINTTGAEPDNSAMLDVSSTEKGILIPRMTEEQRRNIPTPVKGLLIYQIDGTEGFYYYDGSVWTNLSLVNFTESNYTYDSKTGVKFTPNNSATNIDIVLETKGAGGILAQQPDGTRTGGNKRGNFAVDLQTERTSATQVASGIAAAIVGGYGNTASGGTSTAMGSYTSASGGSSTAMGIWTTASGNGSIAMGIMSDASGVYSTAMGANTTAPSAYETVIGRYNTNYTPVNTSGWIGSDRLFVVGNGISDGLRSNAFTILKNAYATIGGSLTLNDNGANTSYLFPETRGTSGQVLQTDGSGNTNWSSIVESQWTTTGSDIYYNTGNVGIGTSNPSSALQFSNAVNNRKITLFTNTTNDHQFYGFGINNYILRYQVLATNASHVFYAGESSTSSIELFRIKGNGQVVIPTLTTGGVLLNNASGVISSSIGTSGQMLTTNGSGGISWAMPTTGTVTNVSGTSPISVATGTTTAVISIAAATTSSAGSMSAADKAKLDKYPEGTANGQMQYWNGTAWVTVAPGTTGQLLAINSSGIPQWQSQLSIITASTLAPTMTSEGVTFKGVVNPNNLYSAVSFEYGTTTSYGNTTETMFYTPVSTDITTSSNLITGLTLGITYHVRLVTQTILGTFYSNDITFTYLYPGAPLYLGATYQEGLVFSLDETGQHGKVCAFYDQSASATWYDALDICAAYSSGTVAPFIYDDWYLPSSTDLTLMYNNLKLNNLGSFSNSFYWSFEAFDDTEAFYVNFGNGNVAFGDKNANYKVRAVRDF
jgi:hypothetical protein